MEVAIIDWKSIDSRVVIDDLYEHINAPKWVDLTAQDDPVDDEAWFCRPDCDHPKKVEDFFNQKDRTPISNSSAKIQRSASVSDIPAYQRGNRDATLKKRGANQPFRLVAEDAENQDPNFSTPLQYKARFGKATGKSSANKKEDSYASDGAPKLRSTLSARNLFSGTDLLSKVSEFCNELKKLTTRAQDKESAENHAEESVGILSEREKERKPLLEMGSSKGMLRRKKRNEDGENTPITVNVNSIKLLDSEGKLPIRTCPPTPQCFSATPKPLRPRPVERGILKELKQMEKEVMKSSNHGGEVSEKEARSLDVFWFLKPCTLSS
ncbi:RING-type E3 ubiquitin transferase [Salvia divinorum]|uniref:RING-type E3 ubiquitin transferase n=1 Tax=Salvia divinorum TaxID=28513 RepID=A0ABD1HFJ3_SALDI